MTRGRGIDLTLPPTRALTQQRDYRARKAAHIKRLEDENAVLAAENSWLKVEVTRLRDAAAAEVGILKAARSTQEAIDAVRDDLNRALARLAELDPVLEDTSVLSAPPAPAVHVEAVKAEGMWAKANIIKSEDTNQDSSRVAKGIAGKSVSTMANTGITDGVTGPARGQDAAFNIPISLQPLQPGQSWQPEFFSGPAYYSPSECTSPASDRGMRTRETTEPATRPATSGGSASGGTGPPSADPASSSANSLSGMSSLAVPSFEECCDRLFARTPSFPAFGPPLDARTMCMAPPPKMTSTAMAAVLAHSHPLDHTRGHASLYLPSQSAQSHSSSHSLAQQELPLGHPPIPPHIQALGNSYVHGSCPTAGQEDGQRGNQMRAQLLAQQQAQQNLQHSQQHMQHSSQTNFSENLPGDFRRNLHGQPHGDPQGHASAPSHPGLPSRAHSFPQA